jgi:hemerythrin-like domain-containing protein
MEIDRKPKPRTTELPQPGASYAAPLELLDACHQRVRRSLQLLQRLAEHVAAHGADADAAQAAADVLRYFDIAAPLHHEDEERHIFPPLEQGGEPQMAKACAALRAEHQQIAALWQQRLRPLLDAVRQRTLTELDAAELALAAADFAALHAGHLEREDGLVFPAAAARLDAAAQQAMGLEMAARRGLDLSGSAAHGNR